MNKETRLIWLVVSAMLAIAIYALWNKAKAEARPLRGSVEFCRCLDNFCFQQRCYYQGRRHYRAVHPWGRRHYPGGDTIYPEEVDNSPHCRPRMAREGVEKYKLEEAKESAQSMLQEAVRRHYGGKYMDPANWKEVAFDCGISSTGNRKSEQAVGAITSGGSMLQQCTIYARPCRGTPERDRR